MVRHAGFRHSPNGNSISLPTQDERGYPIYRRIRPKCGHCSVLSFDGGGYRGYASLVILKKILRLVKPEGVIFPYLYFDIICGTSTGGLIAILLAVLHLDIDTAIKVYKDLGKKIFGNSWRKTRFWLQDAQFNRKYLKQAITDILAEYGNGRMLMHDQTYDRGCLCFVTVQHREQDSTRNILIRSYEDQEVPDGYKWTILDAALATSAAPTYFEPHRIHRGSDTFTFEDAGAHGKNNPAELAVSESERLGLAGSGRGYQYFLSIGTGSRGPNPQHNHKERGKVHRTIRNAFNPHRRVAELARGFAKVATDVTEVEDRMTSKAEVFPKFPYFRFNPPDLGHIDLANHKAIPRMEYLVADFFKKNGVSLNLCVAEISGTPKPKIIDKAKKRAKGWLKARLLRVARKLGRV